MSAAGLGSRLGMNMPKCLVSVAGKAIIDRQLELLAGLPQVRVVVGFMEERVVEHVRKLRDDVIFVRNPRYATTTTLQSIFLAARGLREPFLAIDGDLIIEPDSFYYFLSQCARSPAPLLGLAPATTDEAVYVVTGPEPEPDGTRRVDAFRRAPRTDLEWTGLALVAPEQIENRHVAVFECLEPHLPMRGAVIRSLEVDTPGDLERASRALFHGEWPSLAAAASAGGDDRPLRERAQAIAERFWTQSTNAALGPSELYDRQEQAIARLLIPRLSPNDLVLDLGCGDGRFTCQVAHHCQRVVGIDIAPQLVRTATQRALMQGLANVSFLVGGLDDLPPGLLFDHALCMGVLTTIPDEARFEALVRTLVDRVRPGGQLLLKDSLTAGADRVLIKGHYAAIYRNHQRYRHALEAAGLELEEASSLAQLDEEQTSMIMIARRREPVALVAAPATRVPS